jgi:hypothetical protein
MVYSIFAPQLIHVEKTLTEQSSQCNVIFTIGELLQHFGFPILLCISTLNSVKQMLICTHIDIVWVSLTSVYT